MTSTLNPEKLFEICRIPVEQLEQRPGLKIKFKLVETPEQVHRWAAQDMAEEVKRNNAAGLPTREIVLPGARAAKAARLRLWLHACSFGSVVTIACCICTTLRAFA